MLHFIQTDLIDVLKVNIVGWGTVGFTQSGLINMAEVVQAVGTAALIMITIGYTVIKFAKLLRDMQWEKEDRENDK